LVTVYTAFFKEYQSKVAIKCYNNE
jgi:hypothetical protein